ncbi:MAG: hypothetical protein AUK44_00985 [Porphyromonadaceae bacterium CG2_30_38_12]|nr:MAG: hypothetical protein AUK44_00985 [Porphyromonadaceae bacterium CG2_30_38_12]
MRPLKLVTLLFFLTQVLVAQNSSVSHEKWDAFLKNHVNAVGQVNYKEIKKNSAELEGYLKVLESAQPTKSWTKNESKAYWINAYNAFTVKLIVDNYPLKSIKDIGSPWDKKFIKLANKIYTLNDIENKILRPQYQDARIHFAIVCAAKSCPILRNKAYFPATLDKQLDESAKLFLSDTSRNKISVSKIEISEIFTWFNSDFTKNMKLIAYLNQFSPVKIASNAKITNITYNWTLNE